MSSFSTSKLKYNCFSAYIFSLLSASSSVTTCQPSLNNSQFVECLHPTSPMYSITNCPLGISSSARTPAPFFSVSTTRSLNRTPARTCIVSTNQLESIDYALHTTALPQTPRLQCSLANSLTQWHAVWHAKPRGTAGLDTHGCGVPLHMICGHHSPMEAGFGPIHFRCQSTSCLSAGAGVTGTCIALCQYTT